MCGSVTQRLGQACYNSPNPAIPQVTTKENIHVYPPPPTHKLLLIRAFLALSATLALAGCGGGGSASAPQILVDARDAGGTSRTFTAAAAEAAFNFASTRFGPYGDAYHYGNPTPLSVVQSMPNATYSFSGDGYHIGSNHGLQFVVQGRLVANFSANTARLSFASDFRGNGNIDIPTDYNLNGSWANNVYIFVDSSPSINIDVGVYGDTGQYIAGAGKAAGVTVSLIQAVDDLSPGNYVGTLNIGFKGNRQ